MMPVRSPCTNICEIDRRSGWCKGCARTIDEIIGWPTADETARVAIVALLPERRAAIDERKRKWFVRI